VDLYTRTLVRAAELVGSEEALARTLKVTPNRLAAWLAGVEDPPADVFLRAVDIVTDGSVRTIIEKGDERKPSDSDTALN
jgi:DNA-binding transcriptional regulator YdaS (Cro superfamily)